MSRLASVAVGGYYPYPNHLILPLAQLIDAEGFRAGHHAAFVDPCIGEGDALMALVRALMGKDRFWNKRIYGCELERGRARTAAELFKPVGGEILHGDAFRIVEDYKQGHSTRIGASLLFLNSPYHTDRQYGRLEERFLRRFTRMLIPGSGILAYVIPAGSLAASAATLATEYGTIHCFRFPDEDYRAFQQVIVLAVREQQPYQFAVEERQSYRQIMAWAEQPMTIPVLPEPGTVEPLVALPTSNEAGFQQWRLASFDLGQMQQNYRAHCGGKANKLVPLRFFGADRTLADLVGREHETAMPPKPGHIASSLAAGLLNGQRIEPDDAALGLPPLLMRGVYQREHQTIETKRNKDGEETGIIQIEQPKLRVAVLDLNALTYHDLQPGTVPTGTLDLATMNVADVLIRYSRSLAEVMARQCPPLHKIHDPNDHLLLPPMARLPYRAQSHAAQAALKLLLARRSNVLGLGEVGTGKSTLAMQVIYALSPEHYGDTRAQVEALGHRISTTAERPVKNVLILCPPHLLAEWRNETRICLPGARVVEISALSDLDRLPDVPLASSSPQVGHGITFYLLGRETAKLGHALASGVWVDSKGVRRCPGCGAPVAMTDDEVIRERATCEARRQTPVSLFARLAHDLAPLVMPALNATYGWMPSGVNRLAQRRIELLGRYGAFLGTPEAKRAAFLSELPQAQQAALRAWADRNLDLPGARAAMWCDLALAQRFSGQPGTTLAASRLGGILDALTDHLADVARGHNASGKPVRVEYDWLNAALDVVFRLCFSITAPDTDEWIASFITRLYPLTIWANGKEMEHVQTMRRGLRRLVFIIRDAKRQADVVAFLKDQTHTDSYKATNEITTAFKRLEYERAEAAKPAEERSRFSSYTYTYGYGYGRGRELPPWSEFNIDSSGQLTHSGEGHHSLRHGDLRHLEAAMGRLMSMGRWRTGAVCGERLYASTPNPRRVPLATFISRHRKGQFDALIVDEGQDYVEDSNAQTRAAFRLIELGLPVLVLSGSIMRGYASQLHPLLWSLYPEFREVFGRTERKAFVTKYGYRKQLVEEVDDDDRRRAPRFGVVTDRVDNNGVRLEMRDIGEAPGILPQLLLDWILPRAITLHKEDLDEEVPPAVTIPTPIEAETEEDKKLVAANQKLAEKILTQIARDTWESGLAGRLFGALSQATTYLDRCTADVGNVVKADRTRAWESSYPESVGGGIVATAPLIPEDQLTAKERKMLDILERELAGGNNCIVFIQNSGTPLVTRLQRIIRKHTGETAVFLDAKKAKTKNRREWISENVVKAGCRVLIVNPTTVKTGLNNLVHFNVAIYFQLPNGDAEVYRQSIGRIHRIGQRRFVRVYPLYYAGTAQEWGYLLLMAKVSASLVIDGLDITAALEAAGAGEETTAALLAQEFGQIIYKLMTDPEGAGKALRSLTGVVARATDEDAAEVEQDSLWDSLAA